MSSVSVNYLAVLVGALLSIVIGFLWYMPPLFGNVWMQAIGKTKEELEKDFRWSKIVWAFVCGFLIAYTLARFISWTGKNTAGGGLAVGLLAGIGLIGATYLVNDLFEGRPRKLFYVYWLHHLFEFALIGLILGAWM